LVLPLSEREAEIADCVDKVLTEVLGEFAKRAVMITMNEKGITPSDIVKQPDRFMDGLRSVFGSGAGVLEKAFIFEVCKRFRVDTRSVANLSFADLVKRMRNHSEG